ncbi:nucleotidyltransferase domain-containing protein [Mycolicibacterium sp. 018/SC-01/001]|uniref:nucleotidyltransferase domain-containing protein n=1 Tax=Mycolicibacterium sp. 018/SC-01/001 TaxID=2592069 RepID=UPI00117E5C7A|nr:nucleotidyltransferase domain-containing protein [Mycolicibacterium sp. 018/SC-01/001]TRW79469.1 nucleotidyltransferase domain-containing protein [Mycolicibacterium sp. 018/SC-01/001]
MQLNKPFGTVTPTLDGDVLGVLASADGSFTIAQVQRVLATASGEGIRKVLNRLSMQGVVLRDQAGRTNVYRLNTEHVAAQPIIALSRLNSAFLERLEAHLHGWVDDVKYAAVFGSAATGRMTLDSDIDLLLVRASPVGPDGHDGDPDRWDQRLAELARLVTAWTGNDARIVEYTEADLALAAAGDEPLLRDVARHGLTVNGARTWFTAQLRPPAGKRA